MKSKFEKVKDYYEKALWNMKRVHDAVKKEWITPAEYESITGEAYSE